VAAFQALVQLVQVHPGLQVVEVWGLDAAQQQKLSVVSLDMTASQHMY
jgi:hypothetical protein